MERSIKGDYIGFTFGDVHSSELGLVRVSDGSRYNTDLLPPLEDKVGQVAGRDGEVLFGTNYKAKEIKVPVAFDNMTEESFRRLTQLLADKKPKSLWFDESPYKELIVKSANVQDFKWVCFDESQNIARKNDGDPVSTKKRIYKGEGTLIFKCRSPYAQSRVTYLDDSVDYVYVKEGYKINKKTGTEENPVTLQKNYNFEEWKEASGLVLREGHDVLSGGELIIHNSGDIEADFKMIFEGSSMQVSIQNENEEVLLAFSIPSTAVSSDYIEFDSKLKLLKGLDENKKPNGNIYNNYIKSGDFFKIPPTKPSEDFKIKLDYLPKEISHKHYYYI